MEAFEFPVLSRAQVRELDRVAIEEFGVPGVVLMDHAGRGASEFIAQQAWPNDAERQRAPRLRQVAILCGAGNNGGDGYVVARYLHDWGLRVTLLETASPDRLSPDAAVYRRVTQAMGIAHREVREAAALTAELAGFEELDLFVDAYLGTGFEGELRPQSAELLRAAKAGVDSHGAVILALDVPSGFDVDSGAAAADCLPAAYTLTFGAHKLAYQMEPSTAWTGQVWVLPIGAPRAAYERVL